MAILLLVAFGMQSKFLAIFEQLNLMSLFILMGNLFDHEEAINFIERLGVPLVDVLMVILFAEINSSLFIYLHCTNIYKLKGTLRLSIIPF